MCKNIVLIGLMGSGKTTIGKLISQTMKREFVDTDLLIEQESKKTINEIFELYGEELFRRLEVKTIENISKSKCNIISTGGGSVENQVNIDNLKENSVLFYLEASPSELYERIQFDSSRPLLKNQNPLGTIKKLLDKREPFYKQADETIKTNGKQANEIVEEILEKYKNYETNECKC